MSINDDKDDADNDDDVEVDEDEDTGNAEEDLFDSNATDVLVFRSIVFLTLPRLAG